MTPLSSSPAASPSSSESTLTVDEGERQLVPLMDMENITTSKWEKSEDAAEEEMEPLIKTLSWKTMKKLAGTTGRLF